MTAPPNRPHSKGMAMIAAYREARLGRRLGLQTDLREARTALRLGREGRAAADAPAAEQAAPRPLPQAATPAEAVEAASVFAGLVSLAVAVRAGEAAATPARAAAPPSDEPRPDTHRPDTHRPDTHRPDAHTVNTPVSESTSVPSASPAIDAAAPAEPATSADTRGMTHCTLPAGQPDSATKPDEPAATSSVSPEPAQGAPHDPPLAEIGLGPGMLIRLSQLGVRTIGDLAHADAAELREALGEISRLVDVETWINSARQNMAARD